MIARAVEDEERNGRLARTIRDVARRNGARPDDAEIGEIVSFVRRYVEGVPRLLEQGSAAAASHQLAGEVDQMLRELEAYWLEHDDLIPDDGLIGIMDDAYASLFLLQAASDYCKSTRGRALLGVDLSPANRLIRTIMGEQVAAHLEARVYVTLSQTTMQELLRGLLTGSGLPFVAGPGQIWPSPPSREYIDARLASIGCLIV